MLQAERNQCPSLECVHPIFPNFQQVPSFHQPSESEPLTDAVHSSTEDSLSEKEAHRGWRRGKDDKKCDAIATSLRAGAHEASEARSIKRISERLLMRLLRQYPQGKVWNFDRDGNLSSEEEVKESKSARLNSDALERRKEKKRAQAQDGKRIAQLLPGARSLAIIGLWDCVKGRPMAAGVVWSCDPFRILTEDFELPFLKAFADVVVAEVHRLEAQRDARMKSDFISSISHELRSPLHGILGSGECIQEQGTDNFTAGLVSQIMSCGKTLLVSPLTSCFLWKIIVGRSQHSHLACWYS